MVEGQLEGAGGSGRGEGAAGGGGRVEGTAGVVIVVAGGQGAEVEEDGEELLHVFPEKS